MEDGDRSAKKARLNTQVKQELVVHKVTGGGGGGGVMAAAEIPSRVEGSIKINMDMDISLLQCPICSRPLKPPVFQCKGGHLACGSCLAGQECRKCDLGGGRFDVPSTAMDAIVSAAMIECPHDGCQTRVAYHELSDHRSACPHAPCFCTEPGCGFAGLPPALVAHLTKQHSWPSQTVRYGKVNRFDMPVSEPRRLLLGAEDGDPACLLVQAPLGAATAMAVVCIRAAASPRPQYNCKMWANLPAVAAAGSREDTVQVHMMVKSSTSPGAVVAVDEGSFLTVPPTYLVGTGASKKVPVSIRIDRISSRLPLIVPIIVSSAGHK